MSYPLEVPVESNATTSDPPQEKPKKPKKYDMADLEEYCLWLYGLYEEEVVNSN